MNRISPLLLFSFPIAVTLALYAPTSHFFSNQYDDAYITYRYAINLARGNGLVFNPGEHADATSSFLYTLLLAALWRLGAINLELAAGLIGILSLGLISLLVYRLALQLSGDKWAALIVALGCGLNGLLAGWALSGMDTLPWTAIVTLAIYLMVTDTTCKMVVPAIAAAAFMRFEGILLAVPYAIRLCSGRRTGRELTALLALLGAFILFYIIKRDYYGVWISHAFEMKELAEYYKPAPRELIHIWFLYVSVPALLALPTLFRKKYRVLLAYVIPSLFSLLMGPRSDWARYSVHLIPMFYAFSAPSLLSIRRSPYSGIKTIFFASVIVALFWQSYSATMYSWQAMTRLSHHQVCRKQLGDFINHQFGEDQVIASSDVGAIAYVAINHRFVDLIGLTSPEVLAHYEKGESADNVIMEKKVKYLADTFFQGDTRSRFDLMLAQFRNIKQKSAFTADRDHPLFACEAGGGLRFLVTRIVLRNSAIQNPGMNQ